MKAEPEQTAVERLEELRVRGILMQLARDEQLIDVRCEMPQCYCHLGRKYFDPISPNSDWEPTADSSSKPAGTAGFFMLGRARFGLAPVGGNGEGNGVIFYGVVDDNLEEPIEFFTNRRPSVLSRAGTETSRSRRRTRRRASGTRDLSELGSPGGV